MSSLNPMLLCKAEKLLRHVFTSLVILESSDFDSKLILGPRLVGLECNEGVRFLLEHVDSPKSSGVINKGHPVLETLVGLYRKWPMDIRVDEFKGRASMIGRGRE